MAVDAENTDKASDYEEIMRQKAIGLIRKNAAKINTNNETGFCFTCNAFIGYEKRWCNSTCRDLA